MTIVRLTPESSAQERALFLLNLAVVSANAAIARNEEAMKHYTLRIAAEKLGIVILPEIEPGTGEFGIYTT